MRYYQILVLILDFVNLKFVLLDYEHAELMSIMSGRSYGTQTSDQLQQRIKQSVIHIRDIPKSQHPAPPGTIQIGLLPYFPSFGMWLIDPDKPHGKIMVEMYHHRTPERQPMFTTRPEIRGTHGMVASTHYLATMAGWRMFEDQLAQEPEA